MRNMSFILTQQQILDRSKMVTRRLGWESLKSGDFLQPVQKSMGLKKGEPIIKLGRPVVIFSLIREPLRRMLDDPEYGKSECALEGFPNLTPAEFVEMFCNSHKNCTPETIVSRIAFNYNHPPVSPMTGVEWIPEF